jgi:multiple sugar transport system ATP-binding protein
MAEIRLEGVTKRFKDVTAIDELSFTVADGEFVVLLGPTGAGKTTTLRLIAGLERPEAGRVFIAGEDVTRWRRRSATSPSCSSNISLYPHLSVFENLAFPLRSPSRRVPEAEIEATRGAIARMLRIDHKLKNRATQLSRRRDAARRHRPRPGAPPSIYLMDEPLSSLDAKLREDLRLELKRIQLDLGATILYVTHDQIEAMTWRPDRRARDGRLVQVGAPREIYESPSSVYVAQRLGSARDQPVCRPACCLATGAARHRHRRRADRAPCAWSERRLDGQANRPKLTGSSIWAIRATFISASTEHKLVDAGGSGYGALRWRCRSIITLARRRSISAPMASGLPLRGWRELMCGRWSMT